MSEHKQKACAGLAGLKELAAAADNPAGLPLIVNGFRVDAAGELAAGGSEIAVFVDLECAFAERYAVKPDIHTVMRFVVERRHAVSE